MQTEKTENIALSNAQAQLQCAVLGEADRVRTRALVREMAKRMGFGLADQTRFVTAVSELVQNAIRHAGGGTLQVFDESNAKWSRLRVIVEDQGPGIANVEHLLANDFMSGSNPLGLGLPGVKRLATEFHIRSVPGKTRIEIALVRLRHEV